uniref:Uncharacterized protein n=1 Tax=Arundo donax TaxID=35708 RepID=A0A0A9AKJ6_ARUDO
MPSSLSLVANMKFHASFICNLRI